MTFAELGEEFEDKYFVFEKLTTGDKYGAENPKPKVAIISDYGLGFYDSTDINGQSTYDIQKEIKQHKIDQIQNLKKSKVKNTFKKI